MKPMEKAQLQALQKRMDRIPKAVRLAVKPALEAGAREIVSRAKALVPVDSGALRDSIGYTFGEPPKTRATGALRSSVSAATLDVDLKVTIFAGNDEAYYARWVEFGTQPHSQSQGADISRGKRQSGAGHPGSAAQPFFYPAWRSGQKTAKARISRAIGKAVREGWR